MRHRATIADRVLTALDRRLVHAVVRALDRAREVAPVSGRGLSREHELALELAQELELARDFAQELANARAGNTRELAGTLELVRTLELALVRDREPDRTDALGHSGASTLDHELELERELDVVFIRAPAFVRAHVKARALNRIRALARALVCTRNFAAACRGERAFSGGARVTLTLMALVVQMLPVSRQLRHLEEFCAELLELRWWQRLGHVLGIGLTAVKLRWDLNNTADTAEGVSVRRKRR